MGTQKRVVLGMGTESGIVEREFEGIRIKTPLMQNCSSIIIIIIIILTWYF